MEWMSSPPNPIGTIVPNEVTHSFPINQGGTWRPDAFFHFLQSTSRDASCHLAKMIELPTRADPTILRIFVVYEAV